nr:unnamed protein product [Callosobruchus chinensis]
MTVRFIGDATSTCHMQLLSHKSAVGNLSIFYPYSPRQLHNSASYRASNARGPAASHPKTVVLQTSRTKRHDRTFVSRVSKAWHGVPGDVIIEPTIVGLFKSRVNKLPLT